MASMKSGPDRKILVSRRAVPLCGSSSGPNSRSGSATSLVSGRAEDEKANADARAKTADLESNETSVASIGEDDLHVVPWLERALQSEISKSLEDDRSSRVFRAGAEGQSDMHNARKDRRSVEVAVKAAAPLGHPEVRRALRGSRRRGNFLESGVRE
jgi:hypothetical protein